MSLLLRELILCVDVMDTYKAVRALVFCSTKRRQLIRFCPLKTDRSRKRSRKKRKKKDNWKLTVPSVVAVLSFRKYRNRGEDRYCRELMHIGDLPLAVQGGDRKIAQHSSPHCPAFVESFPSCLKLFSGTSFRKQTFSL